MLFLTWWAMPAIVLYQALSVLGSAGDRSMVFQRCVFSCKKQACKPGNSYMEEQPYYLKLLGWNCLSDCKYFCMWKTVEAYEKDGTDIPQFHGKWPFVRVLGVQEPASTIFSVLNGVSHLVMIIKLRRQVSSKAPMFYIWHLYAFVAMNAWLWATVFHTRDTDFTEMMDYVSAVLLVMFSMFTLCVRVIGTKRPLPVLSVGAAFLAFYVYHVHYLAFVKFDYGYNMQVNVAVGLTNSAGWLLWYSQVRRRQRYAWRAALSVCLLNILVLLELLDFVPLWWTFDAHSLWHAGTAPIAFIWYRFAIDDCNYLLEEESATTRKKKKPLDDTEAADPSTSAPEETLPSDTTQGESDKSCPTRIKPSRCSQPPLSTNVFTGSKP